MSTPQRTYLTRALPWLNGCYVNIHWTVPNPKFDPTKPPHPKTNRPTFLNGQAVHTVDEAVALLAFLQTRPNTRDVYACQASQREAQSVEVKTKTGTRNVLKAVRNQANAAGFRAIFLDLDVKPSTYPTTKDALLALKNFCTDCGLPTPSMLVFSGTGGAHVYWTFDRPVTPEEWTPMANALAEAQRRHGLMTDLACTTDAARILRVPGTLNHKAPSPLPVSLGFAQPGDYPVDVMQAALAPYMGATVHRLPPNPKAKATAHVNDELSGGISSGPPIDIDTVAQSCGFVSEGLTTGGKSFGNPLWNLATLLSVFALAQDGDGRVVAHRMAKGHPAYTQAETDALYDRKVQEREGNNVGWPSCNAIANAGCTACGTCPLRPLNKSPLSFGKPYIAPILPLPAQVTAGAAVPPPTSQDLPHGYMRDPQGRVIHIVPQPDGTNSMRVVSDYKLFDGWLEENPYVLHFTTQVGNPLRDRPITISFEKLQSREYAKHLAMQGMVVLGAHEKTLKEFLLSWIAKLQTVKGAVVSTQPYGWSVSNGKLEGFVYAGQMWGPNGTKPSAATSPILEAQFKPTGEMQPWRDAADLIIGQQRPAINAIIATSFAAPLMRFTGKEGTLVSAYSAASGVGKSAAQAIAASVWGHSKTTRKGLEDTQLSTQEWIASLRNLPLYWDELKDRRSTEQFVKTVFALSRGVGKGRLNSSAEIKAQGTWQTMMVVSSNESMMDAVSAQVRSSEAGILRVFEFTVEGRPPTDMPYGYVDKLVAATQENYGHAGLVYAQFLGNNAARVAKEVEECQAKIATILNAPPEERFWVASITCILMGARYANELGLTKFNLGAMMKFLGDAVKAMRQTHRSATITNLSDEKALSTVFGTFLSEHRARGTLLTNKIPMGSGRPAPGSITVLSDVSRLDHVVVRIARDQNLVLVDEGYFKEWLRRNGYAPSAVVEAMRQVWHARLKLQRDLYGGVHEQTGTTRNARYCMEIDLSGSHVDTPDITDTVPLGAVTTVVSTMQPTA